jgi:hypothetical protein
LEDIGDGKLLLVAIDSSKPSALEAARRVLLRNVRESNIRLLHSSTFAVYTNAPPDQVRDWLAQELVNGDSALVVEFERWSSYGANIDRAWLLRRGH